MRKHRVLFGLLLLGLVARPTAPTVAAVFVRASARVGRSISAALPARLDGARLLAALQRLPSRPFISHVARVPLTLRGPDGAALTRRLHPQGMSLDARQQRIYLTAVELRGVLGIGGGRALLFELDFRGRQLRAVQLSREGDVFHPGGIDHDAATGQLVTPIAAYYPGGTAQLVAITPATLKSQRLHRVADHLGFTVALGAGRYLAGSWDSTSLYVLGAGHAQPLCELANPTPGGTAHQDGQALVPGVAVLGGYSPTWPRTFSGLDIVRVRAGSCTLDVLRSLRWSISSSLLSAQGRSPLENATFLWAGPRGAVYLLSAADDQHSTAAGGAALDLYRLEAR
ncbi:MAG: hypothetical protein KC503_42705 [Myxococcales bacterium]|nr:hypothetical protein [Myxococcales bacterium]